MRRSRRENFSTTTLSCRSGVVPQECVSITTSANAGHSGSISACGTPASSLPALCNSTPLPAAPCVPCHKPACGLGVTAASTRRNACKRNGQASAELQRAGVERLTPPLPAVTLPAVVDSDRESLAVRAHAQSLMTAGKHVEAYLALSAALASLACQPSHVALLRARRAQCSYALMNYKECAGDCHAALEMWRTVEPSTNGEQAPGGSRLEMVRLGVRAHAMREEYSAAESLCAALLDDPAAVKTISTVDRTLLARERASLPAVADFRRCVSEEAWPAALEVLPAARPLVDYTPLHVLEAVVLLEVGDVDAAREALLPYLPTVAPPPSADAAAVGTASLNHGEQRLRYNADAHYVLATALLAKASAYSGRAYVNIAAALLQRCLVVNPAYAPALALGNTLVRLEEAFTVAESCVRSGDYARGVRAISDVIEDDPQNRRGCAALRLQRATLHMAMSRPLQAVEDCTRAIDEDPRSASAGRAYALRMRALAAMRRSAEAAADAAAVRRLCPGLLEEHDILAEAAVGANPRAQSPLSSSTGSSRPAAPQRMAHDGRPHHASASSGANPSTRATPPPPARPHSRPFPNRSAGHTTSSSAAATAALSQERRCGRSAAAAQRPMTLYDVLEVSPRATLADIRHSFKRLTLQYHPDRLVGASDEALLRAVDMFKQVNNAHAVLSDDSRRRAYDATIL